DSLAQQPRGVGGAYAGAQARREFRSAIGGGSTVLGHLPNPVRHGQETGSELLRVHLRARQRWCAQVARVDRFKGSGSSAWRLLGCHVESPRIIEKIRRKRLSHFGAQRFALLWGSLVSCGRLAIGRAPRVARDGGGSQPPRRLPHITAAI